MAVRPLGNRLVVRRWPEVELTQSGLWLPSDAREKPQLGDVLAVGPGARCRHNDGEHFLWWAPETKKGYGIHPTILDIDLKVGEVVVFAKMVSRDHEYVVNDERLLILPYNTIYAAIRGLSIAERNS